MGPIGTTLYHKPHAGNTLLHAQSAHPKPLVRSIPYSQYLRLRKLTLFEITLLARGYSRILLCKTFIGVYKLSREDLLFKVKTKSRSKSVRLLTTYNRQHSVLPQILQKHWCIPNDSILSKYLRDVPEITSSHFVSSPPPQHPVSEAPGIAAHVTSSNESWKIRLPAKWQTSLN